MKIDFQARLNALQQAYNNIIKQENVVEELGNGVYDRYQNPVLTAKHAPLTWRYDLNSHNQSVPDGKVWH